VLFLAWVVLGLVAGVVWRKLIDPKGKGMILDVMLGILGACIGGDLFSILGPHGVTWMNLYDMLVAGIGSAILLAAYNFIGRDQPHRRWDDHAINGGSAQVAARGKQ
jgi:uncharacterized membrane protein YeaQ/YmgE (transglycosylase-associated protein family)